MSGRRIAGLILATLWLAVSAWSAGETEPWRISAKPERDAVRAVVDEQLAALRVGNFSRAYRHAAAGIRRQFSESVYAAMIRRGYPALVGHRSAEAGIVRDRAGREAEVVVTIRDAKGEFTRYRYQLLRESGQWRVAGVTMAEAPPARAD